MRVATAREAADPVQDGMTVAASGFSGPRKPAAPAGRGA
jgi:acyl CoA:acetate/3-ketoacid CoA transferase alpha subunit